MTTGQHDVAMQRPKDDVARDLIRWHFRVGTEITEIYRIHADQEDCEGEPIKLLEVDPESSETGHVDAFFGSPDGDIPYSSVVAYVTPRELALIRLGVLELPEGWSLDGAERFPREFVGDAEEE